MYLISVIVAMTNLTLVKSVSVRPDIAKHNVKIKIGKLGKQAWLVNKVASKHCKRTETL